MLIKKSIIYILDQANTINKNINNTFKKVTMIRRLILEVGDEEYVVLNFTICAAF